MTNTGKKGAEAYSKGPSTLYLCGATIVLMFSILTFGHASAWYEYVTGIIFLGLTVTLAYQGIRQLAKARTTADVPDTRN